MGTREPPNFRVITKIRFEINQTQAYQITHQFTCNKQSNMYLLLVTILRWIIIRQNDTWRSRHCANLKRSLHLIWLKSPDSVSKDDEPSNQWKIPCSKRMSIKFTITHHPMYENSPDYTLFQSSTHCTPKYNQK